jgi:hypothetical protein
MKKLLLIALVAAGCGGSQSKPSQTVDQRGATVGGNNTFTQTSGNTSSQGGNPNISPNVNVPVPGAGGDDAGM